MPIRKINPENMRRLLPGLSQAVRAGDTLYISGQAAVDNNGNATHVGDVDGQLDQIYRQIETALKAEGGSLHDLVKITAYITHPSYYANVVKARNRYLGPRPCASSTVIIPCLARFNLLAEIEAIAVVGETAKSRECIDPPSLPKPAGHSHMVKVGNVVYLSGLIAWGKDGKLVGKGDAYAQAKQLYENMDTYLRAAGASRSDVVKTTTFYTHPFHYDALRKAREEFYKTNLPTSTGVVVSHLVAPDAVLEIEGVAVIGGKKRITNPDTLLKREGFTSIYQADGTVYISGQVARSTSGTPVGKGDIDAQLKQVYANLDAALKAVGGARANVAKTTTYFLRPDYFPSVRKAREEFYGGNPPTSTAVIAAGLVTPDWLVEIEAIAVVD